LNYSFYIDKLYEIAKELNVEIVINFELDAAGRTHYIKSLIEINEPKAKAALVTIAHELGHFIYYLNNRDKRQPPVRVRERAAYRLGWYLLRKIEANITKEEWRDYHVPDFSKIKETGGWLIESKKQDERTNKV